MISHLFVRALLVAGLAVMAGVVSTMGGCALGFDTPAAAEHEHDHAHEHPDGYPPHTHPHPPEPEPIDPPDDDPPEPETIWHGAPVTGATECDIPLDGPGWTVWHDHGNGCHRHHPELAHPHSPPDDPPVVVPPVEDPPKPPPPPDDPPVVVPPVEDPPKPPPPPDDPPVVVPPVEDPPKPPPPPDDPPVVVPPVEDPPKPPPRDTCTPSHTWIPRAVAEPGDICGCAEDWDGTRTPMTWQMYYHDPPWGWTLGCGA